MPKTSKSRKHCFRFVPCGSSSLTPDKSCGCLKIPNFIYGYIIKISGHVFLCLTCNFRVTPVLSKEIMSVCYRDIVTFLKKV